MDIPEPAIRWLVLNVLSNTELASVSNVCRSWREKVKRVVLDVAKKSLVTRGDDESNPPLLLLPSMTRFVMSGEKDTDNEVESYCLAWFRPSGIKFTQLAIDQTDDDSDDEDQIMAYRGNGVIEPFAPGGEQLYAGSEDDKKFSRRPSRSATSSLNARLLQQGGDDRYANCLYQWNGCETAEDVLEPFGYASTFLKNVMEAAKSYEKQNGAEDGAEPTEMVLSQKPTVTLSTYAVRGATLARPEGFCLCWDHDDISRLSANVDGAIATNLKPQDRDRILKRRHRRRRELQREVLPKVLKSAPQASNGRQQLGIQQPCVQFLNADSSHAVRLFTPPFQRGPAPAPITVFCVGIATEDGCFMSGLKRRFEIGHLYPETPRDDMIERSPICLCTDAGSDPDKTMANETGDESEMKDDSYNSDDSSCDMSTDAAGSKKGYKCGCQFSGLGEPDDEDHDDVRAGQICRGSLGPGAWHCYVAIFDGVESTIRIDGEKEVIHCSSPSRNEPACLDGLTIGADHTFDMSLCFGQGSDGEGEGAVAELAVFKGRLPLEDIEVMERSLMSKYAIPSPRLPEEQRNDENRYTRLAHAMLSHAPGHKIFVGNSQRVPLKFMAKHRTVAWRQSNPVTGEPIRVQRIGTKAGDSSSDW